MCFVVMFCVSLRVCVCVCVCVCDCLYGSVFVPEHGKQPLYLILFCSSWIHLAQMRFCSLLNNAYCFVMRVEIPNKNVIKMCKKSYSA